MANRNLALSGFVGVFALFLVSEPAFTGAKKAKVSPFGTTCVYRIQASTCADAPPERKDKVCKISYSLLLEDGTLKDYNENFVASSETYGLEKAVDVLAFGLWGESLQQRTMDKEMATTMTYLQARTCPAGMSPKSVSGVLAKPPTPVAAPIESKGRSSTSGR